MADEPTLSSWEDALRRAAAQAVPTGFSDRVMARVDCQHRLEMMGEIADVKDIPAVVPPGAIEAIAQAHGVMTAHAAAIRVRRLATRLPLPGHPPLRHHLGLVRTL